MMFALFLVNLYKVQALIPLHSKRKSVIKPLCFCLSALFTVSLNSHASEKNYLENNGKISKLAANEESNSEALQQTLELNFSPESREKLRKALNAVLPDDISVIKTEEAGLDFHSRFFAKSKSSS